MTMLAKVPRVFILAGSIITFLIIYTQFYVDGGPTISRYDSNLGYPPNTEKIIQPAETHEDFTLPEHASLAEIANAAPVAAEPDLAIDSPDSAPEPAKLATLEDKKPDDTGSTSPPAEGAVKAPAEKPTDKFAPPGGAETSPATTTDADASKIRPYPSIESSDVAQDYRFLIKAGEGLNLTEKVHYTRRCIKPVFSKDIDRDEVADIGHSLLNGTVEVDLWNTRAAPVPDCEQIKLNVPKAYPKQSSSHIIFGVSTDLVRLNGSLPAFEHWLANSGSKLIAVVTDYSKQTQENITMIENKFRKSGILATFVKPLSADFTVSQNHFAVLVDLVNHSDDNTKWFGLIDDDTFMPDMWPFADALATLDHTEDVYVGQLSEDFQAVRFFGFMAFGGAGAYFSAPLARKLAPKALKCIHEASSGEGDIIIRDCVYSHSKAKLTMLDGLWQQDMKDDVSGFFEAGIKPLVLHHWKSWYHEPMADMALASKFCGDCFLQRFRFEQDTVFTSGYSIVTYPKGMSEVNLDLMEGTWLQAGRDYDFSVGPLRDRLPKDRKKSYKLKHAEITPKGELRQLYVYRTDRVTEEPKPEEDDEKKDPLSLATESSDGDHEDGGKPKQPLYPNFGVGKDGALDEVIELIWTL
ncbi:uncharacterized protein B0I36DRAFT_327315 [Microdochium trichocladiopsis]|uniref:Glycosyltransferase family 31 protein n=1 Tax=Microdochium trichocladiopsis TaxID=1682393 RepID=A0A9P8Y4R3_9PEZI|nr:uncharacterized protein B0I36DRAFT_327315 [Microdochium trichocladiopsis]KAH7027546.1 hypothetical protein B0I36DRAFT_327315 [Microdochium trichocladiopsis]